MSKRRAHHDELPALLETYGRERALEYHRYSEYHMRLIDQGYTVLDCWTTGRYWVMTTDYSAQTDKRIIERAGEKGFIPTKRAELFEFLDGLFYAADRL